MHLPWTQIANEVLDHAAPELAVALPWHEDPEVSEALALRGLVKLFRWARERCPNDRPPSASAVLVGPTAARLIARTMGWSGDPETLVSALERVQPSPIVTRTAEGIRINGLDRYDGAWRKNYKDAAAEWDRLHPPPGVNPDGSRPDSGRKATGQRPDSDRQTQTQTQTQIDKQIPLARAHARAEPPQSDQPAPTSPAQRPAPAQRALLDAPPLLDQVDSVHRTVRGRPLEWGPAKYRVAVERAIGDLAAEHGGAEVLRRERNALTYPPGRFPYFAEAGDLPKHWGRYAEPFPEDGAGGRKDPNQGITSAAAAPLPTAATHGAVWAAALSELRDSKPYIATQLAHLREVAASERSILLEAPDEYGREWAEGEFRELLEQLLAPRAVVIRAPPGAGGPAPPLALVAGGGELAETAKSGGRGA